MEAIRRRTWSILCQCKVAIEVYTSSPMSFLISNNEGPEQGPLSYRRVLALATVAILNESLLKGR